MNKKFYITFVTSMILTSCALADYGVNSTHYKVKYTTKTTIPITTSNSITDMAIESPYKKTDDTNTLKTTDVPLPKDVKLSKPYEKSNLDSVKPHKPGDGYLDYNVSNPTIPPEFSSIIK